MILQPVRVVARMSQRRRAHKRVSRASNSPRRRALTPLRTRYGGAPMAICDSPRISRRACRGGFETRLYKTGAPLIRATERVIQ